MWLPEHVRSRYASGHVIVIPADHRGYEHGTMLKMQTAALRGLLTRGLVGAWRDQLTCITLRGASPPRICDCGMYALDWCGRDGEAVATNGEETT